MRDLMECRQEINEIDRAMAELFVSRMKAVKDVATYKIAHGIPVLDPERERANIERNTSLISDPALRTYYVPVLEKMMEMSRHYQHSLMTGVKIAYSGVEGAFAQIAASRIFPEGELVSYPNFESAYQAVVNGECENAVLPIENSYAGEVGQVVDLMFNGSLFVSSVYDLRVNQNLIGLPGATLQDVKIVVSHTQALSQCAGYIQKHGFAQIPTSNTAIAARDVAERGDKSYAAIASSETAMIYGLSVLEKDINESDLNTTRFAVFSRSSDFDRKSRDQNFILLFTVPNIAGSLADALDVIGKYHFNMKALRSRPMRNLPWEYYFYLEVAGDDSTNEAQEMFRELEKRCKMLKIVGHFTGEEILKNGGAEK